MTTNKTLKDIDESLDLIGDFRKVSQNTVSLLTQMRQEVIFRDGTLPAKFKVLAAALWGISARCEPCFKYYILKAKELGVTEKELGEFLAIASTMGGCVGEMWALKAYKAFKDSEVTAPEDNTQESTSCCAHLR